MTPQTTHPLIIRSIRKGWGQGSEYYCIGERYSKILEEQKPVKFGGTGTLSLIVYRIYDRQNRLKAEIEAGSEITLTFVMTKDTPSGSVED